MLKAVLKSPPSSARARFCAKSRPSETVQRDSADKLNTVSKSRRNGRNMRNKLVLLDSEHLRNTVTKSPHSCAGACFPREWLTSAKNHNRESSQARKPLARRVASAKARKREGSQ